MAESIEQIENSLTPKQRLFCKAYLSNGYNGAEAARTAGYSEHTAKDIAAENLSKPYLKKYLEFMVKETENKLDITREWKMQMLKATAEASFNGQTSDKGLVNPNGVVSCISELNKMQGHYAKTDNSSEKELDESIRSGVNEFKRDF